MKIISYSPQHIFFKNYYFLNTSWKLTSELAPCATSGVIVYTATLSRLISTRAKTCFGNCLDVEAAKRLMSNQHFLPAQAEILQFNRKFGFCFVCVSDKLSQPATVVSDIQQKSYKTYQTGKKYSSQLDAVL